MRRCWPSPCSFAACFAQGAAAAAARWLLLLSDCLHAVACLPQQQRATTEQQQEQQRTHPSGRRDARCALAGVVRVINNKRKQTPRACVVAPCRRGGIMLAVCFFSPGYVRGRRSSSSSQAGGRHHRPVAQPCRRRGRRCGQSMAAATRAATAAAARSSSRRTMPRDITRDDLLLSAPAPITAPPPRPT